MNPYDFVRIDWNRGVQRQQCRYHERFVGMAGRIEGTITALTPFFIPETDTRKTRRLRHQPYLTNSNGAALIPGSSLKGLLRSLVETVGYGCWWLVGKDRWRELPQDFRACSNLDQLCVACRMFGLIRGQELLMGHVGFDDATCSTAIEHDPMYTIILSSPKPHHTSFYLDNAGHVAGRKFYFHHSEPPVDKGGWLSTKAHGTRQNQYIQPVGAGSTFTFSAHFDNLTPDELALLLYALELEPDMRHKLGYGKPAGFGSVQIALTRLELIDYQRRYMAEDGGRTIFEGVTLRDHLAAQVAPYVADRSSITLQDLRRIWSWPGRADLHYPDYHWFQENSQKHLDETP